MRTALIIQQIMNSVEIAQGPNECYVVVTPSYDLHKAVRMQKLAQTNWIDLQCTVFIYYRVGNLYLKLSNFRKRRASNLRSHRNDLFYANLDAHVNLHKLNECVNRVSSDLKRTIYTNWYFGVAIIPLFPARNFEIFSNVTKATVAIFLVSSQFNYSTVTLSE